MVAGDKDSDVAESTLTMFSSICSYCKYENAGRIIAGGTHGKDDMIGRPGLEEARKLGLSI